MFMVTALLSKITISNQNRFVGYGKGGDDKIFLRPNQYDDERTRRLQHLGDNAFNGYSWNDCSQLKLAELTGVTRQSM